MSKQSFLISNQFVCFNKEKRFKNWDSLLWGRGRQEWSLDGSVSITIKLIIIIIKNWFFSPVLSSVLAVTSSNHHDSSSTRDICLFFFLFLSSVAVFLSAVRAQIIFIRIPEGKSVNVALHTVFHEIEYQRVKMIKSWSRISLKVFAGHLNHLHTIPLFLFFPGDFREDWDVWGKKQTYFWWIPLKQQPDEKIQSVIV